MNNEYNELVEERDLDQDIKLRQELIERAKELQSSEDKNVYSELSKIQKEWRRVPSYDSILDAKLNEEFEEIVDSIYAKRKWEYQGNEKAKRDLITQVKGLVNPENWSKATAEVEELMNKWRETGSAGKDSDDSLWNEFNEARKEFFDNKHKYWESLQNKFENARKVKTDLIEKAKTYVDSQDWSNTSVVFKDMLDEWKSVGNAGKEFEEKLWKEFDEVRQQFYAKRNEYYDNLHEKQSGNANSKKELVEKAKEVVNLKEYTKENTQLMKDLSAKWRSIGSSGKEENDLWTEFRETMDSYFNGLTEFNNKRHAEWLTRMQETKARKQDMIMNQKRQIKRMQDEIATMYSQREIDDTNESIEEKKAFIEQLEKEIADIDSKLNK